MDVVQGYGVFKWTVHFRRHSRQHALHAQAEKIDTLSVRRHLIHVESWEAARNRSSSNNGNALPTAVHSSVHVQNFMLLPCSGHAATGATLGPALRLPTFEHCLCCLALLFAISRCRMLASR